MIDNTEQIRNLLKFDNEDAFYFVQILKRKKEHPELGSNSYVVKTYFLKKEEELDYYMPEIKCLCDFHNARCYINLNRRSFERTAFHTMKKICDQIMNKDYREARKAYNSVCGEYSLPGDKTWVVDIDSTRHEVARVADLIDTFDPIGDKVIATIPTKNGWHIITKAFNRQQYTKAGLTHDVHTNNPTILYIP